MNLVRKTKTTTKSKMPAKNNTNPNTEHQCKVAYCSSEGNECHGPSATVRTSSSLHHSGSTYTEGIPRFTCASHSTGTGCWLLCFHSNLFYQQEKDRLPSVSAGHLVVLIPLCAIKLYLFLYPTRSFKLSL